MTEHPGLHFVILGNHNNSGDSPFTRKLGASLSGVQVNLWVFVKKDLQKMSSLAKSVLSPGCHLLVKGAPFKP
jgi:hypothetical protein